MSLMSFMLKNDARSLARRVTMWLTVKNVDTPDDLFFALTVSINKRLLFPTLCCLLVPTNPHSARVVGYILFSLCVIHKEDLSPAVGALKKG
jgi:hypothetical protein